MKFARHLLVVLCVLSSACQRPISGPLPQRGYLWQRDWTPATERAFLEAQSRLDNVIILGGEIIWDDAAPHFIRSSIRWETVAQSKKPIGLALRVAPFAGQFQENDANARFIRDTAKSLLADATEHDVPIAEFQLDFDCAQKKLAGYRAFLHSLGASMRPTLFRITALPAWLGEPEFGRLLDEVDGYVLQVHSVPAIGANESPTICDPQLARTWTAKAARLGRPFSIALPTYRCLGGYNPAGKLLGVAMDSIQPTWPRGTRVLEFGANAEQLAQLVADWKRARPKALQDLIWYRVPAEADARNWRWPTLSAVMTGRVPVHNLEIVMEGENPIDLVLANNGEADEHFAGEVAVDWNDSALISSDALPGWTLRTENHRVVFAVSGENALRLSPGDRRDIGWLRYDRSTKPRLSLATTR